MYKSIRAIWESIINGSASLNTNEDGLFNLISARDILKENNMSVLTEVLI